MSFDLHLALGYFPMLYGDEVEEIKPWYRGEPEAGHRRLGGSGGWRVDDEAVSTYCGIQIFTLLYRVKPPWKFTSGRRKYVPLRSKVSSICLLRPSLRFLLLRK